MKISITLFASILFFSQTLSANVLTDSLNVIYGEDDRYDVIDYDDLNFAKKSANVATRVFHRKLITLRDEPEKTVISKILLKDFVPLLCSDENFADQTVLGDCSGFLIAPDKLITAGHCMVNEKECKDHRWVFNFDESTTQLSTSDVYSCKKIINQKYEYSRKEISDYAVIQLDRPVTNFVPLKIRKLGKVKIGTPLVVIGHPMGLPKKITDGGQVNRMNEKEREEKLRSFYLRRNYFTANLDAYSGNSGSPVFNKRTGKVEGILIQGAEDFRYNYARECLESVKLSDDYLDSYEKVMRITKIPGLKKLIKSNK